MAANIQEQGFDVKYTLFLSKFFQIFNIRGLNRLDFTVFSQRIYEETSVSGLRCCDQNAVTILPFVVIDSQNVSFAVK